MLSKKTSKRSFAILGMAAMSMAAMTPVYAAEVPGQNVKSDAPETKNANANIWADVYKDFELETGKLYSYDSSGKLVKLSDEQARAVNPLHDINVKRQGLIMDSVSSGDWSTYYAFEATQAPYHYDLNKEGKLAPNKNYFSNLVASSHRAMVEARMMGDKETEQIWANDLKQVIKKYNAAPGMSVYIPQVNSNDSDIAFYEIEAPSKEYFDSVYNNNDVRTKGYSGDKYWYENDYFLDNPEIFVKIVESIKDYTNMSFDDLYSITSNYDKAVADKAAAEKAEAEKVEADKATN